MSDPYYDQTVLFLPFERPSGIPNSVEVPLWDFSKMHWGVTKSAATSKIYTADSKYGTGCWNIDATFPYLTVTDSSKLHLGSGDFTVELWIKTTQNVGLALGNVTTALGQFGVYMVASGKISLIRGNSTAYPATLTSNASINTGTWRHVSFCKAGGTLRVFIDGNLDNSIADAFDYTTSNTSIGVLVGNLSNQMLLDEIRITLAARYTANFTPTQISLADYPVPAFSPKLVIHYRKSSFDYNSLPKYKAAITHYRKSPFDYNSLPKAKRYIRHEKNSIRDWSALARLGRECVKGSRVRHDFNNATFGSLSISNQGTIAGIIKIYGSPVKRRVRLYESQSGAFVREMWSGDDGAYLFTGLKKELLYTVTSTDYAEQYNDVIGTNISPT